MRAERTERKTGYGYRITGILSALLCMTLISFWMLGGLYARYTTQGSGSDSARVAVFDISDSNTLTRDFAVSLNGANEQSIKVMVQNKSEVAVRYRMEFAADGNLPLKITAQSANQDTITVDPDTAMSWTVEKPAEAGRTAVDEYTFVITLEHSDYRYSGGVANLTLTVTTEQMD